MSCVVECFPHIDLKGVECLSGDRGNTRSGLYVTQSGAKREACCPALSALQC